MSETNVVIEQPIQSRRVAKNTFLLFVRMFVLMIINLYSIRILTNALGDDDYGLFNVLSGVVIMLTCVSTVFSISTQRFLSCELGNRNESKLSEIFSKSLNLNLIFSIISLVLFETIGLWYVSTIMVIPPDRVIAAHYVFQFSIFSFINLLIQVPFLAAVMAHEDMGIYTIISTMECLLKLAVIYMIGVSDIDNMVFYGLGLYIVSFIVLISYVIISNIRYKECRYKWQKDSTLYRELLSFFGWTFYGSLAGTAMIQGNTLLLNQFYAFANAAFGICLYVYNAFMQLCNSVVLAIRPAMIKAYVLKQYSELNLLFSFCNKSLMFFLTITGIPLIMEMPTILDLWLPNVTEVKILFTRLIIVYAFVMAMQNPITIIMQASGNIKYYHLITDTVLLLCLPVSWLLFKIGSPVGTIMYIMIIVTILAHFIRLYCLNSNYSFFSIKDYLLKFVLLSLIITIITFVCAWGVHRLIDNCYMRLLSVVITTVVLQTVMCYFFVINNKEKIVVNRYISKLIKRV